MSIVLVVSLLILFLLVKTYFSNMYAFQDNFVAESKQSGGALDIGAIVDSRYDQFNNNRKQMTAAFPNRPASLLEKIVDNVPAS